MRRGITVLLLVGLLMSLCACTKETEVPPTLEFQNIPWNSSPEEVFEKLGIPMDTLNQGQTEENPVSKYFTIEISDWPVFGETALRVYFCFDNYLPEKSDYFGLSAVRIFYPEDCDKDAILANVRQQYGPEVQEYTLYSIVEGMPVEQKYTKDAGRFSWFSQQLVGDVLSDQGKRAYREALGNISDEGFEACLAAPVAQIGWTEDYYGQFESMESVIQDFERVSWLSISGGTLALVLQEFESAS